MKLDLDADNVYEVDLRVWQARKLLDEIDEPDAFVTKLDEAQGDVFSATKDVVYLVVRIIP